MIASDLRRIFLETFNDFAGTSDVGGLTSEITRMLTSMKAQYILDDATVSTMVNPSTFMPEIVVQFVAPNESGLVKFNGPEVYALYTGVPKVRQVQKEYVTPSLESLVNELFPDEN